MSDQLSDRSIARSIRRTLARIMYGGFYKCPNTGRVLGMLPGDDKVLCPCGRSNPKVPGESTARTGTHLVRFIDVAKADAFLDQCEADDAAWKARHG